MIARKDWLERVNRGLETFLDDEKAIEAFSSQEKFAAHSDDTMMAMSLNALKRHADKHLLGGFSALEQLRKSVFTRLLQKREAKDLAPQKDTVRALKNTVRDLRGRLESLQGEMMVATLCLKQSLEEQRDIAFRCGDEREIEFYKKRRREMLALFFHGVHTHEALAKFDNVIALKDVKDS